MENTLVMFVGNSTISIVEQYRLHLQAKQPVTFILPHKNEVVLKKLFNILQSDMQDDEAVAFHSEKGSCYFLIDRQEPYMKTKREENEALVKENSDIFNMLADKYERIMLIGESSCSFDAVVMEAMLEQLYVRGKKGHILSWCPIQSPLAAENNAALQAAVQKYAMQHTVITAQDENPDGFLSLFKAYNKEIAQAVNNVFQQQ